jgi:hypothetical protein
MHVKNPHALDKAGKSLRIATNLRQINSIYRWQKQLQKHNQALKTCILANK